MNIANVSLAYLGSISILFYSTGIVGVFMLVLHTHVGSRESETCSDIKFIWLSIKLLRTLHTF